VIPEAWSLTIDEETGIPVITVRGELTESEFRQFVMAGRSIPAFWNATKSLWDLRQVTEFPSANGIHSLALFVLKYIKPPYLVAIVVSQDVHFGLSRMFSILGEQAGVARRVFRDYEQARIWLLGEGPPEI
jgi:hypothetical protein